MTTSSICWNVCWAQQQIINSSFADHWSVNSTASRLFLVYVADSPQGGAVFHEKFVLPSGPESAADYTLLNSVRLKENTVLET